MADRTETLRTATILMAEANTALRVVEAAQNQRWSRLHRVVEDAGDQYFDMRIGTVEESLRDKGAPSWLSVLIDVGITFIPITALTTRFVNALTRSASKLLTRSTRLKLRSAELQFERELDLDTRWGPLGAVNQLGDKIRKHEEAAIKFAKNWDPELSNMFQNYANELGDAAGNWPFKQGDATPRTPKDGARPGDSPVVLVKSRLHDWIENHVRLESLARTLQEERHTALFAIATAAAPKKEAEARYVVAKAAESRREPRMPFQRPIERFPETSALAIDELTRLRDDSRPAQAELFTVSEKQQMGDIQLMIEASIWASAYDFTTKVVAPKSRIGVYTVDVPSLPDALWKRLTERYVDPDENKTYKDVGYIYRLGTKAVPGVDEEAGRIMLRMQDRGWDPRWRLSFYFSEVLYPAIVERNEAFRTLVKR